MLAHLKHQEELCFQRNQQLIKQQFSGRPQPSSSAAQTPQKVHLAQKIKPPSRGSCCSLSTLPVLVRYLKLSHQTERGGANASMEVRNLFSTSNRAHVSFSSSIYQSLRSRAVTIGIEILPHSTDLIWYRQASGSTASRAKNSRSNPFLRLPFQKNARTMILCCALEREICGTSTRRIGPESAEPAIAVRR
jgi:hypothetical protein